MGKSTEHHHFLIGDSSLSFVNDMFYYLSMFVSYSHVKQAKDRSCFVMGNGVLKIGKLCKLWGHGILMAGGNHVETMIPYIDSVMGPQDNIQVMFFMEHGWNPMDK